MRISIAAETDLKKQVDPVRPLLLFVNALTFSFTTTVGTSLVFISAGGSFGAAELIPEQMGPPVDWHSEDHLLLG